MLSSQYNSTWFNLLDISFYTTLSDICMGENLMFPFYANTPNEANFFCNLMQNYVVTFYGSLPPSTLQYYDV